MDRRSFLKYLGIGTATAIVTPTLDLDKLLWVPGEKTIFVPAVEVIPVVGNQLISMEMITRRALEILRNNLNLSRMYDRTYNGTVDRSYRLGDSIRVDEPVVLGGPLIPAFSVAIYDQQIGVDISPPEPGQDFETYSERTIKPAALVMANEINMHGPVEVAQLELTSGMGEVSRVTDKDRGLSIRGARAFDMFECMEYTRLDMLFRKL